MRLKLPSRNWLIFLSITGSWTALLLYDRREKKKAQAKWCKLVSHLSEDRLAPTALPRRVTVFLAGPPGDGLRSAREHFVEYVKPVLVAAALDWDVVEGRREGEVRAGLAERIRRARRRMGEAAEGETEFDKVEALAQARRGNGVQLYEGTGGDLVVGRNTWKEYIRGLHEGWLGPMDPPVVATPAPEAAANAAAGTSTDAWTTAPEQPPAPSKPPSTSTTASPIDDASPTASADTTSPAAPPADAEQQDATKEASPPTPPPKKKPAPPPYLPTSGYANAPLCPSTPAQLPPSVPIAFPHILGFFNTPIRMYRFLQQRRIADDAGRQAAALALAAHRPYAHEASGSDSDSGSGSGDDTTTAAAGWEQQGVLADEERDWHKSARKREDGDARERVWLDDMALDARVAGRMARFELSREDEHRASRIAGGMAGVPGRTVPVDDGGREAS